MRKIVLGFVLLLLITALGGAAALFLFRDSFLLSQARKQFAEIKDPQIELGGLHSSLLGSFSLRLDDLKIRQGGHSVNLKTTQISSPLGLLALWTAYSTKKEIPLTVTVNGVAAQLAASPAIPAAKHSGPAPGSPWPTAILLPFASPVPVRAEISLDGGELTGAFSASKIQSKLLVRTNSSALEASGNLHLLATLPGAEAALPLSVELKFVGSGNSLKLQTLLVKAAGLEASAGGEFSLQPVSGTFHLTAGAPDLARVSLRPEDKAALGLTAQPSGAFAVKIDGTAGADGKITSAGLVTLENAVLPLKIPEKTVFSKIAAGQRVEGPVSLSASLPFRAEFFWPLRGAPLFSTEKAFFSADASAAQVSSVGVLEKPRGVPLKFSLTASSGNAAAKLESFQLSFHTLALSGSGILPAPLGKSFLGAFRADIKSLEGFPELLPALRQPGTGAALESARGSVLAEGRVRLFPDTPMQSFVELKTLAVRNVRLPLDYKNESLSAKGVLLATLTAAGSFDAGALNVAQSVGTVDLGGLSVVTEKLSKKIGRALLFSFEAKGNPQRLQIKKASIKADGLGATLSGTIVSAVKGKMQLDLRATAAADLAPLREYLPKLPLKISSGSMQGTAKVEGTWLTEGGVEKSPLTLTGAIKAKVGNVEMAPAAIENAPKAKAAPPAALLPNWPIAKNTKLSFRFEVANFSRGPLQASGIVMQGDLSGGSFSSDLTVARTFGGKATLRQVSGSLFDPNLAVRGLALVNGIDLSQAAGFVDPTYKDIVKGSLTADATFQVPALWSDNLMGTATSHGKASIKNGYISTASLDGLVNQKLSGIPGLGSKSLVKTGGMAMDISTAFQYANSVATLKDFLATTPKKDEMRLAGTMALTFDADMRGEAHLASAPVQGSVREANSDPEGRLVVPVHFKGNLKNPSVDIASETIQAMLGKTAQHEAVKLKDRAISEGKKKLEEGAKDAAGGLLKDLGKNLFKK